MAAQEITRKMFPDVTLIQQRVAAATKMNPAMPELAEFLDELQVTATPMDSYSLPANVTRRLPESYFKKRTLTLFCSEAQDMDALIRELRDCEDIVFTNQVTRISAASPGGRKTPVMVVRPYDRPDADLSADERFVETVRPKEQLMFDQTPHPGLKVLSGGSALGNKIVRKPRLKSLPAPGGPVHTEVWAFVSLRPMENTDWDRHVALHDLFVPVWANLEKGTAISVVVDGILYTDEVAIGSSIPDNQMVRIYGEVSGQVKGCRRLTILNALVDYRPPYVDLLLTDASSVVAHGLSLGVDMFRLVEVCSGVACSSTGLCEAGFKHVASVEWSLPLVRMHQQCHPDVPVLHLDLTSPNCAQSVLSVVDPPFTMMAGISCQPYSTAGSQGGSNDSRSSTLPAALRFGHLCQCPLMIIECVCPAQSNKFVQAHLRALESLLGYRVTDFTLRLEDNWVSKRMRWWVVAVHPCFAPVCVPEWPHHPHLCIRDVMPFIRTWPDEVMQELLLDDEETRQFTLDGSHMRRYLVQLSGKLPTSLHSWGSQSKACPCLCRSAGFSDHLILQRGVFGQVLPGPVTSGPPKYRHFHPSELCLLNAMLPLPGLSMTPSDLRLGLCAVGQLASPLQSLWVGANVACQLQYALGLPTVDPSSLLQSFKVKLFSHAKDLFTTVVPSSPVGSMVQVVFPYQTKLAFTVPAAATLRELRSAESALNQVDCPSCRTDEASGRTLDDDDTIRGLSIRADFTRVASGPCLESGRSDSSGVPEPSPEPMSASVLSNHADVADPSHDVDRVSWSVRPDPLAGLTHLQGPMLAALVPPLLPDVHQIQIMRQETAGVDSRLLILHNQGSAMADDELILHVRACVKLSDRTDVHMIDPVLAVSWLRVGTVDQVRAWFDSVSPCGCAVSVVPVNEHWIPVVWTRGQRHVSVSFWEVDGTDVDGLNPLHGLLAQAWNMAGFVVTCTPRTFAKTHCGAAAFAFLAHVFLDKPLPQDHAAVMSLHGDLQESFATAIMDLTVVPRPWCWGLGVPDTLGLVSSLLQLHGVPLAQSPQRAKSIVQSLGKTAVTGAVTGSTPWRSLKALANQQTPPLQLVLPDEQQQKTMQKPAKAKKKSPAERNVMPSRPRELDPAKIQLESGAFCTGQDEPLPQLDFSRLGPLVSGVALAS